MCVSSWSRSWCASTTDHGGFLRAADLGENRGGDSVGDKVVEMLVIVQRQVLGGDRAGVVHFLDKVVDTSVGVQR